MVREESEIDFAARFEGLLNNQRHIHKKKAVSEEESGQKVKEQERIMAVEPKGRDIFN